MNRREVLDWCRAPGKGGLKIAELRTKARELGLNVNKRDDIKTQMLALCQRKNIVKLAPIKDLTLNECEEILDSHFDERRWLIPFNQNQSIYRTLMTSSPSPKLIQLMKKFTWFQIHKINFEDGLWETF